MYNREYTPERISELRENEIFVFGSNLAGSHGGGAARLAHNRFGAVWGQGVGLQGQSYAIPTMQGGVETIKPYVDDFIRFARSRPDLKFYVTQIGCGIAGFKAEEIAPLFSAAVSINNIILPEVFCSCLMCENYEFHLTETGREIVEYTSIHMLLDIILSRNIQMQYNTDTIAEDLEPIISQNKRRGLIDYTSMMPMYMTRCGREYPLLNLVERLNEGKMTIEDFSNLTLLPMSYARRVAARLFYATQQLLSNDIFRERNNIGFSTFSANEFRQKLDYTLISLFTGRWNCGDTDYLIEDLELAKNLLFDFIRGNWEALLDDNNVLDNKKVRVAWRIHMADHPELSRGENQGLNEYIRNAF